jgi:phospholipid-binding lipoprotein MlaA
MRFKNLFLTILFSVALSANAMAAGECFEKTSRAIFKFNMGFDKAILKPVAKVYNKLPDPVKSGTGNFTSNIATLLSVPNYVLQGELKSAADATGSFLINTTIGILGFANPAEKLGFKTQKEDVGQTLGTYGFGTGCYFVLPILGPTTARDSFGMVADSFIDPFSIITWREREILSVSGSRFDYLAVKSATAVDFRGDNMTNFNSLEKNSLDMYSSMKSIYLQDRERKVNNSSDADSGDWGNFDN